MVGGWVYPDLPDSKLASYPYYAKLLLLTTSQILTTALSNLPTFVLFPAKLDSNESTSEVYSFL